ncbi:MAG: hypothetical protein GY943_07365 [Chloroflexi bacterium]|nr:hypothetical protein [Chloroflexota bacterium]
MLSNKTNSFLIPIISIDTSGSEPEAAWLDAMEKLETAVREWEIQHPKWQPPDC